MTWSIIARDKRTGRVGIAVATKFFAVGSRVPHIETGVGAVATQAFMNPYFGPRGLAILKLKTSAADTVKMLVASDDGRDHRQVHVMDAAGAFAAHTGSQCIDWCGHSSRETFSVAGNMLAGARVIEQTAAFLEANEAMPFARRLIGALQAGEAAGGDKRGKQSAALLIHDGEDYPMLDIRVDDHTDPLAELQRLEQVSRERFIHFRRFMPSKANPHGLTQRADLEERIAASIAEGYE